jgi:intraflagellar transport protein 122
MHRHEEASFFLYGRGLGLASQAEDAETASGIVESAMQLACAYSAFGRLKEDMSSPFRVWERGSSFYLGRFVVAYLNSIRRGEFKARYLYSLNERLITGVSFPEALFSLLNECENHCEYRLMKWCAEQLSLFVIPPAVQEVIDHQILKTSGMSDGDEGESCERCGNRLFSSGEGPLLWCSECKAPIVFSCYSFKVLRVIAVRLDTLTAAQVKDFLKTDPPVEGSLVDVSEIINKQGNTEELPSLSIEELAKIEPSSIIVSQWKKSSKVPPSYLINPGLESVHQCRGCNSLFNDVDFELTFLETGTCPLCKTPLDVEAEGEFADTVDSYSDLLKQLRDFASEIPIHF